MVLLLRKNCMLCIFFLKLVWFCVVYRGGGFVYICMWWKEIWYCDEIRLIFMSCMFFLVNVVVGFYNVGFLFIIFFEFNIYIFFEFGFDRIVFLIF